VVLATANGFATAEGFLGGNFLSLYQRMPIATRGKVQYCLVALATAKGCLSGCQRHSLMLLVPKDTNCNSRQGTMLPPLELIVSLHVRRRQVD